MAVMVAYETRPALGRSEEVLQQIGRLTAAVPDLETGRITTNSVLQVLGEKGLGGYGWHNFNVPTELRHETATGLTAIKEGRVILGSQMLTSYYNIENVLAEVHVERDSRYLDENSLIYSAPNLNYVIAGATDGDGVDVYRHRGGLNDDLGFCKSALVKVGLARTLIKLNDGSKQMRRLEGVLQSAQAWNHYPQVGPMDSHMACILEGLQYATGNRNSEG